MSCIIDNHFIRNVDYKVADLAHYCGITQQAVYSILNNQSVPRVYVAIKMCDFFTILNARLKRRGYDSFSGRTRLLVSDLWIFDQMKIDDSS